MKVSVTEQFTSKLLPLVVVLMLVGVSTVLWQPLVTLLQTQDASLLAAEVERLGWLAPLAYLALNVVQIVGAPIPGYPVQFLGGVLFGAGPGGVYAAFGTIAGGVISAWLARTLGRPFIEKQISAEMSARYNSLTKLASLWVWVVVLLIPLGDFPYYLAGLSRVKLKTLALAILLSRGPFTFLITWAGATSVQAPAWVFGALLAGVLVIVALGYAFKTPLTLWLERHVLRRLG